MDEVINKLIDIDKQARRRVSKAKKASIKSVQMIDEKKKEIQEKNDEIYIGRISALKIEKQKYIEQQRDIITQRSEKRLQSLSRLAETEKQAWADKIYSMIIEK